ncbi:hypothetical protein D9613_011916 [Agrocybe pediades]|uniref:Uncharacterized protein n=1 Tax=Agrocybe pediades TaxID=84607 RepID=A0A8H4VJ29_9AGAR|nr:hypothetical protein D9613_011916 [Agrocybe pediades]
MSSSQDADKDRENDEDTADGLVGGRLRKDGLHLPGVHEDDDTARRKGNGSYDGTQRSIDTLLRYLGDQRHKFFAALGTMNILNAPLPALIRVQPLRLAWRPRYINRA